jgi:beta-glucosidase
VYRGLGDRVSVWWTLNEPLVSATEGYFSGRHAPGIQDPLAALRAGQTLLLAHGRAVQSLRAAAKGPIRIGIILNLTPAYPASPSQPDIQAAQRVDAVTNRLTLDAILRGRYPEEVLRLFGPLFPEPQPNDLRDISAPIDLLGVNYYSRALVRHDPAVPIVEASEVRPESGDFSEMWEIYPPGIYEILKRVWQDYRPPRIMLTENGVPLPDTRGPDGRVQDPRRVRFLRDHLVQVHKAVQEGVPVLGYFCWSLMDNFEWALGYGPRFGLVYVDYPTQARIIKDSGRWFSRAIRHNGFDPNSLEADGA